MNTILNVILKIDLLQIKRNFIISCFFIASENAWKYNLTAYNTTNLVYRVEFLRSIENLPKN